MQRVAGIAVHHVQRLREGAVSGEKVHLEKVCLLVLAFVSCGGKTYTYF